MSGYIRFFFWWSIGFAAFSLLTVGLAATHNRPALAIFSAVCLPVHVFCIWYWRREAARAQPHE